MCNIITYNVIQKVKNRKYDVDIQKLQQVLRKQKKDLGLSNKEIAIQLCVPLTNVEHWFRTDKHFSIPTENIWYSLKALLQIKTDEFDASIMEFVESDSKYDIANRIYGIGGIAPTLTAVSKGFWIVYDE